MGITSWLILIPVLLVAAVVLSFIVETSRPKPADPEQLIWADDVPVRYVEVNATRLRYIKTGAGPVLVLLHTLRTQLDLFQKIIPDLARHFTVYAIDYPGHGWSDIPDVAMEPEVFIDAVAGFLEVEDIQDATLAGISIGGTIPLVIAARRNPRVQKVISINPYDYARGSGIRRSSFVARIIFTLAVIPVLGDTVMRMRNRMVEDRIFMGGVYDTGSFPRPLLKELYTTGCRPGHYRSFLSLIRNAGKWEDCRNEYRNIDIPVLLIYGEDDWSNRQEREANRRAIPGVKNRTLKHANHFLSLDAPEELTREIIEFIST